MPCDVPRCHRMAGWRTPSQIKKNKTGFRCREHKYVRLARLASAEANLEDAQKTLDLLKAHRKK